MMIFYFMQPVYHLMDEGHPFQWVGGQLVPILGTYTGPTAPPSPWVIYIGV